MHFEEKQIKQIEVPSNARGSSSAIGCFRMTEPSPPVYNGPLDFIKDDL